MKRLSVIMAGIMAVGILCLFSFGTLEVWASPELTKLISSLAWRADGQGDYLFQGNGTLKGVKIASDGAVEYLGAPGTYELNTPCLADSLILSLAANWTFSGKVTLEINVTGDADDYLPVTNGVPRQWNGRFGSRIKWRATLTEGSKLSAVRITYKDIAGTAGSWGNPKLSGFGFKKPVYIKGSNSGELFNYQVPIKIGESSAENCDLKIKGVISADFKDVRFTQADAETLLPHYVESIDQGAGKKRVATFWVKIPQIPIYGLPIYIYYGKVGAEDLSNGKEAFDFFEDFTSGGLDLAGWQAYDFKQGILEYKLKSENEIKSLDMATLSKEEIIAFFQAGKDFEWARVRKSVSPAPLVDKEKTTASSEEVPNLADFAGVSVAADGDLVLEQGALQGKYTCADIYSPFKVRILVPEYKAVITEGASAAFNISANAGKDFKANCLAGEYYYASRKDFSAGNSLKWRLDLSRKDASAESSRLKECGLDFRPGAITITSPTDKENLATGRTYAIKWSAQEYEPSYVMGIAYSLDAGKNYTVITENTLNTGKYSWLVPQVASNKALLKVYDKLDPNIYATSSGYFSIGRKISVLEEEAGKEEAGITGLEQEAGKELISEAEPETKVLVEAVEEEKAKSRPGTQLYELLIMPRDNTVPDPEADKDSYKKGDILVIVPAGHIWSETEKNSFLIVQAYLTEKEANDLVQPKEIDKGVDAEGNKIRERVARRKFRIDLNKEVTKLLKTKPLIEIKGIEEKPNVEPTE